MTKKNIEIFDNVKLGKDPQLDKIIIWWYNLGHGVQEKLVRKYIMKSENNEYVWLNILTNSEKVAYSHIANINYALNYIYLEWHKNMI